MYINCKLISFIVCLLSFSASSIEIIKHTSDFKFIATESGIERVFKIGGRSECLEADYTGLIDIVVQNANVVFLLFGDSLLRLNFHRCDQKLIKCGSNNVDIKILCDFLFVVSRQYDGDIVYVIDLISLDTLGEYNVGGYPVKVSKNADYILFNDKPSHKLCSSEIPTKNNLLLEMQNGLDIYGLVCVTAKDADINELIYYDGSIILEFMMELRRSNINAANKLLEKALSLNDSYARALMHVAFRDGLWGASVSNILADLYFVGADKNTVDTFDEAKA